MWMVIEDGVNTHGVLILNAAAQGNNKIYK